jgi:hypothetical protein
MLLQERLLRRLTRPLLGLLPIRPLQTIPLLRPRRPLRLTLPRHLGLVRGGGGQCRCSPGRGADGVSLHLSGEHRQCQLRQCPPVAPGQPSVLPLLAGGAQHRPPQPLLPIVQLQWEPQLTAALDQP